MTPAVKVVPENATSEATAPTVTRKACLVNGGIVYEDHSTAVSDLVHAMVSCASNVFCEQNVSEMSRLCGKDTFGRGFFLLHTI